MFLNFGFPFLSYLSESLPTVSSGTTLHPLPLGSWYEANLTLGVESIRLTLRENGYSPYILVIDGLNHSQIGEQLFFGNIANTLEDSSLLNQLPGESGIGGCVRNVILDSSGIVDLEDGISSGYPAMPGCPREEDCFPSPCENEGVCLSSWEGYTCDCGLNYMGQNCTEGT